MAEKDIPGLLTPEEREELAQKTFLAMHDNVCKLVREKLKAMKPRELKDILAKENPPAVTSILEGIRNETARRMARPMIYQAALAMLLEKGSLTRVQIGKYSERMLRETSASF